MTKETTLYIKNMVCDRCVMAVDSTLRQQGLSPLSVELGKAVVEGELSDVQREALREQLRKIGFELLDDRRQRTIEQIKTAVIKLVRYEHHSESLTLSEYLRSELHQDYSSLSKLFSEYASKTIERYYMEQRIERVKELLTYDEQTLSQIAMDMNYSSVAYLSSQFKTVTGMTPSQFKQLHGQKRKKIDEI